MKAFLLLLLFFSCSPALFVYWSKRKFEEVLPSFVIIMLLVLYFSGLAGSLRYGFLALLAFAVASPLLTLLLLLHKKDARVFIGNFFSIGFVVFILCFFIIYAVQARHYFSQWDELSHWRPFLFETLRLDQFYSSREAVIFVHKNYPPLLTLFEYFWCKVHGGTMIEPMAYRALNTWAIVFILPVLKMFSWNKGLFRNLARIILFTCITLAVPSIVISAYASVYIDACFGILIGYGLGCIFLDREWTVLSIVRLSLALAAVILAKGSGYLFILIILGVYLYDLVFVRGVFRQIGAKPDSRGKIGVSAKLAAAAVLLAGLPFILQKTWQAQVAYIDLNQAGYLNFKLVTLQAIRDIFTRTAPAYQTDTFLTFIVKAFSNPVVANLAPLTYLHVLLLTCLGIGIIALLCRDKADSRQLAGVAAIIFAGGLAYAVSVGLGIVLTYGDGFAQTLNSWERHLNVYSVACSIFLYLLLVIKLVAASRTWPVRSVQAGRAALAMLFILAVPTSVYLNQFIPMNWLSDTKPLSETYNVQAADVLRQVDPADDKIYVVASDFQYILWRNATLPLQTNAYGSHPTDPAAWAAELLDGAYAYVYLVDIDDAFKGSFAGNFAEPDQIAPKTLYKIEKKDGSVILIPAGTP